MNIPTAPQISRATGPLPGRGIAPPSGSLVRGDLSLDLPAIKALAKARYALKLARGIVGTHPANRRSWCRQILRDVRREALDQRHQLVWAQMPRELPYTAAESAELDVLKSRMACAPINARGNAQHKAAAGRHGQIVRDAQRRAYDAILQAGRV